MYHPVILLVLLVGSMADEAVFDPADCPPGHFCTGRGITPIPCPAGAWNGGGVAFCTPCESGSYTTKSGSSFCTKCPKGHTCATANLSPESCPLGTYNDQMAQIECVACAPGTYTPGRGAVQCTSCPAGSFCDSTAELPEKCSPGMSIFVVNCKHIIVFSLQAILALRIRPNVRNVQLVALPQEMVLFDVIHVLSVITASTQMKNQYHAVQELQILCIAQHTVLRVQVGSTISKAVQWNASNVRSAATVICRINRQKLVQQDIFV